MNDAHVERLAWRVVDADCHVAEPADLWTSRTPAAWAGDVPRTRRDRDTGRERWWIGNVRGPPATDNCFPRGYGPGAPEPLTLDDVDPACIDAVSRLAVMDGAGVLAEVLYPNFFAEWAVVLSIADPQPRLACVRAYNDFLVEWASAAPDRLVPVACIPFWDVGESVAEIQRVAELGHRAMLFDGSPHGFGLPFLSSPEWDPVWAAAQDAGLSVSLHIMAGNPGHTVPGRLAVDGPHVTYARGSVDMLLNSAHHLNDLLLSGILARFPELRFAFVESGIGWIPFCLEACDHHFVRGKVREGRPELTMLPSEYFHRQVFACYWFELLGPNRLLDVVGPDNVMFESDFPHQTSIAPDELGMVLDKSLAGQADNIQRGVAAENAARLYNISLSEVFWPPSP